MSKQKDYFQFEKFVEKAVTPNEGEGTESGFFGTSSLRAETLLEKYNEHRQNMRSQKILTIVFILNFLLICIAVALVFIFRLN